jgi:uncharacterized repeat protein (TIGR01451 family)
MGNGRTLEDRTGRTPILMAMAFLLLLIINVLALPSYAAPAAYAIKVEPQGTLPTVAKIGDTVHFQVKITNTGTNNLSGTKQLNIHLNANNDKLSENITVELNTTDFKIVDFSFVVKQGIYDIRIDASAGQEPVTVFDAANSQNRILQRNFVGLVSKSYAIMVEPIGTMSTNEKINTIIPLQVKITNVGLSNFSGIRQLKVQLSAKGEVLSAPTTVPLNVGKNTTVDFSFKVVEGTYDITIDASAGAEYAEVYSSSMGIDRVIIKDFTGEVVKVKFNWTPIIAIIVVIAVLGVVGYLLRAHKLKKEEEKRIADEARRQEIIRKKEAEIAKKLEVRDVLGKHPRDYYVTRRSQYAKFKPSGMTSSGLNLLKREKTKEERDAEAKNQCPKCGTVLSKAGAQCPRCNAVEKIENVRHQIRHYKSRDDVDFKDAETLLRKAEHRINWSDFTAAMDYVRQAETRMIEDYQTYRRGGHVRETETETTAGQGPTIDAKIIGLQGEMTAMPASDSDFRALVLPDDGKTGRPCPKCGRPMYEEICLYDDFEKAINTTWALIEEGENDGAQMGEPKDLSRQATNAQEHGSEELAVRYLRRAHSIAKEAVAVHTRSKTEGIIKFTEQLLKQVASMGEDTAMAKSMLDKAQTAFGAGDNTAARSYAAKADGFLKQLKEDSHRKRANDLMSKVSSRPSLSPATKDLVEKARKLIDAKEYEGAVDLLEAAQAKG